MFHVPGPSIFPKAHLCSQPILQGLRLLGGAPLRVPGRLPAHQLRAGALRVARRLEKESGTGGSSEAKKNPWDFVG